MRFLQSSRWLPLSFCVLALFALVQFTGCSGEVPEGKGGKKRIIILTNGNSPYWDACAKGADDAAHELKFEEAGFVFQIERNDFKDKGQIDKLKSYASAVDIAAVGISVTDENNPAIADAMKSLRDAGIQCLLDLAGLHPLSSIDVHDRNRVTEVHVLALRDVISAGSPRIDHGIHNTFHLIGVG
jgi:hypothetical protein